MKKLCLLITAMVFISVIELNAQELNSNSIQFEENTWTEILAKAKAENKLIFLDAYASWCGPCKHMAKNIFTEKEVAKYYNSKFINAKIDMEKGEGLEIAKKYNVNRYPTFLFIDGGGKVIHQACGAMGPVEFIELGFIAGQPDQNTSYYRDQFESGVSDQAFMAEYIKVLSDACISVKEPLADYFNILNFSDMLNPININLIFNYVFDYENKGFKALIDHQVEFIGASTNDGEIISDEIISKKLEKVFSYSLKLAAKNKNKIEHDKIKHMVSTSDIKDQDKILLEADLNWYKYQKDWPNYVKLSEKFVNAFALKDYRLLNSIAWTFYEKIDDESALQQAVEWAMVSTSLKKEYSNMDTLAALYYKLGMRNEAMDAAQEAIYLGEQNDIDTEETQLLLEKIIQLN